MVVEREHPHVGDDGVDIPDAAVRCMLLEPVQHRRGDVRRSDTGDLRRERERNQPTAGAEVEDPLLRGHRGSGAYGISKGDEGVGGGDFFPRLDAVVPVVGIVQLGGHAVRRYDAEMKRSWDLGEPCARRGFPG
ncbi:MAG TPA: hypothetical protein VKC62_04195 [Gaiellaceae bacterium]|nr:hypothetical protein [Gaiellaceae bacterium]